MAGQVEVIARFEAQPGKEAEVEKILQGYLAPTHAEEGCIVYKLYTIPKQPGFFYFFEIWQSQELLTKHGASEHLKAGRIALEGLVKSKEVSILQEVAE